MFVRMDGAPKQAEIAQRSVMISVFNVYPSFSVDQTGTVKTNTLTLLLLEQTEAYHAWLIDQIRSFLRGNILEVGCGIGNLTGLLLDCGKVWASDIEGNYLKIVKERYGSHPNFVSALIWDIRIPPLRDFPKTFDTVVCSNVLEHIEEDLTVLNHFYQMLSKGGRVVLLVPALKWLYNSLDQDLGHVRRYTKKELATKIKQSGFQLLHLTYFNPFGILGWFINGTLLRRRLLPKHQVRLFNQFVPMFRILETFVPNWIGQSLIAIGEKS